MVTIAVCNQKGGCGKTTTSINLSSCLASRGYKILLIDMDPQSHASLGVGIDIYKIEKSMYDVLMNQEIKLEEIVRKTDVEGLDIAPAAQELLIPLQMQYFPLEGMKQLFKTVDIVTKRLNNNLNVLGILPTLYDGRTNLCKDVLKGIKGYFNKPEDYFKFTDEVLNRVGQKYGSQ